ncbi:MAG TPA: hypothetical protein VIT89_08225 [Solirubrobacterales bacterium]
MPIEMGLWRLNGVEAVPVPTSSLATEQRLEEVLEADPGVLGLDQLLIVGRQVPTAFGGFVDLLALDAQANVIVIELKRNRTPREVVAQALDYGSWVEELGFGDLIEIWAAYDTGDADLEAAFAAQFGEPMPDDLNSDHRLIIVAAELDASTERIVEYLIGFGVPVDVVLFSYLRDGDAEYLARSWVTDPGVDGAPSKKKRPWNGRDFYVSFGVNEKDERQWEDARRYGFVSAGGGVWYSRTLNALKPGHRVFVYIPGEGYVGVGEVVEPVQPISEFMVGDLPILDVPDLQASHMDHNVDDAEKDEYLVRVKWIKTVPREEAFKEPGLFANQNSAVKLRHTQTIRRLEQHFGLTP